MLGSPCASVDTFLLNYWFLGNLVNGSLLSLDIPHFWMRGCSEHEKKSSGTVRNLSCFRCCYLHRHNQHHHHQYHRHHEKWRNVACEGLALRPMMTSCSVLWVCGCQRAGPGGVLGLWGSCGGCLWGALVGEAGLCCDGEGMGWGWGYEHSPVCPHPACPVLISTFAKLTKCSLACPLVCSTLDPFHGLVQACLPKLCLVCVRETVSVCTYLCVCLCTCVYVCLCEYVCLRDVYYIRKSERQR